MGICNGCNLILALHLFKLNSVVSTNWRSVLVSSFPDRQRNIFITKRLTAPMLIFLMDAERTDRAERLIYDNCIIYHAHEGFTPYVRFNRLATVLDSSSQ